MNASLQIASVRPIMGLIASSQMCEAPFTGLEGWIQPISSTPTPSRYLVTGSAGVLASLAHLNLSS